MSAQHLAGILLIVLLTAGCAMDIEAAVPTPGSPAESSPTATH